MKASKSVLNIVRVGNNITFSSLKEIGSKILDGFKGILKDFKLLHHDSPIVDNIDALLLTTILNEEIGGHILGITDVNLTTSDTDEFYSSVIGGKNPKNDVAVVSTKRLAPTEISSCHDYELFITRTLKVSLHEIGHNFGLVDHGSYKITPDGSLCPMSKGEFNKFGYRGYVRAIIDGRGISFCDECTQFLEAVYVIRDQARNLLGDGPVFGVT